MHLNSESGDVALLELTCQMTLDEGSLTDAAITDEHELELGDLLLLLFNHLLRKAKKIVRKMSVFE